MKFSTFAPDAGENGVHDLTQRNVELIRELEKAAGQERTRSDLVAEAIAKFCGSMTFVWVHIIGSSQIENAIDRCQPNLI